MKKASLVALAIVTIIISSIIGAGWWLQAGLQSPIKAVEAVTKTEKTTQEEVTSKETKEAPLWVIDHYVSKTEWEYARDWGISIPQWIERLGLCQAEEIEKINGVIKQGDQIKIPVYKKSFTGTASFYGYETKGTTATGKKWNPEEELVASVFLPKSPSIEKQTVVDVTNTNNGRTVKGIEVEDSGPYAYDLKNGLKQPRVLDLSLGLKKKLGCNHLCEIRYTIRSVPNKYDKLRSLS